MEEGPGDVRSSTVWIRGSRSSLAGKVYEDFSRGNLKVNLWLSDRVFAVAVHLIVKPLTFFRRLLHGDCDDP